MIFEIVNAAAAAYRSVIPRDRWRDPYMPRDELDAEIAAGVAFWVYEANGYLVGTMGIQHVRDVHLIRHAYIRPDSQRLGIGSALLEHLRGLASGQLLVGTWAAARWAIRFYERHGFQLVDPRRTALLLKSYWTIPERQIETSVVLASPPLNEGRAC
jgi:GNAT superfamily N-acetyltransferase